MYGKITIRADYMRWAVLAGPAQFAGSLAHLLNTLKINFAITWKSLSPVRWDRDIAMPGSWLDGLKTYHVIVIARPTLFCH